MQPTSRGFRTIRTDTVEFEGFWARFPGEKHAVNPVELKNWNYNQPIIIDANFRLDKASTLSELGLDVTSEISAQIVWRSMGNAVKGTSPLTAIDEFETTLSVDVPPGIIRRALEVSLQIVLSDPGTVQADLLAPKRRGAVLWEQVHRIKLEGESSQLPIALQSFSSWLGMQASDPLWAIRFLSDDMSAPIEGALWLWVNEDNQYIREMISAPQSPLAHLLASQLKTYVSRQLIEFGLANQEFSDTEDYELGTLGAAIKLQLAIIDSDLENYRQKLNSDRPRAEVVLECFSR